MTVAEKTDLWIYRWFGRNWVQRAGAACTAISAGALMAFPTGTPHRVGVIVAALGATLGQLGSIAPAQVKPDLPADAGR